VKEKKKVQETPLQTPALEKDGEAVAPGSRAEIPAACWRHDSGAGSSLQPGKQAMLEQISALQLTEDPMLQQENIFLTETAACGEPMLEQSLLTGAAVQRRPILDPVYPEGLQPTGRAHTGAGGKGEEEAAERGCYKLTSWEQGLEE